MTSELDLGTRGGRLRAARETAGLSVAALSLRLEGEGVEERSTAQVSRYENGQKTAPLEYVEALARLSCYSLDWIVWGEGDRGTAKDVIRRMREELARAETEYLEPATASSGRDHEGGQEVGKVESARKGPVRRRGRERAVGEK